MELNGTGDAVGTRPGELENAPMAVKAVGECTPVGFGRGRRTGRIAVIQAGLYHWLSAPARVPRWGSEVDLDEWARPALTGAAVAAEIAGFNLVWHYWRKHETTEGVVRGLCEAGADGVIVFAPRDQQYALFDLLKAMGIPCVLAYARHSDPHVPWVACDNAGAVRQAVKHLVALGHKRIGFLSGSHLVSDFRERRDGFVEGMAEAGLWADPELMGETELRQHAVEIKPTAARLFSSEDRATAVMCATDVMATAVVQAAWEVGLRVPEDVAVVGFDDTEVASQVSPLLTTLHQPIKEISSTAMYLAACAVTGQEPETGSWQVVVPAPLVVRESCGAKLRERARPQAEPSALTPGQQERMRELEAVNEHLLQMLYVASHDLRAPLVTIEGFSNRLEQACAQQLDRVGRDALSRIKRGARSMGDLIDALLSLSRSHSQPLNLQRIPIRGVMATVLRDLEGQIAQTAARVEVSPDLPVVICDEVALRQAFMNLVSNALKYGQTRMPPVIRIGYQAGAEEHEFFVQDNGPGVPVEERERIFEPFQRGVKTGDTEGTGIGLSVVKSVVLRHGGRVWVESEPGKGATFRFTLPRREPQAA